MHAALTPAAPSSDSSVAAGIAPWRLGIGAIQGLLLYLLYLVEDYEVWPAISPLVFAPMLLVVLFVPGLLVSALGHLRRRQLLSWIGAAAVLTALLSVYDIWRMGVPAESGRDSLVRLPSSELCTMLVACLFIAHALVLSGARDRRRIASYATYFDLAWKLGVQLAFSALFVGITWLALWLGAALFDLVKLRFLSKLMRQAWFAIPITVFAFSSAMHLTDVRPAIVHGVRNLLLMLASWILPLFALFVAGFLASLPFTGLEPLWGTRKAAAVLLCTDAALVVLINAAWQNGTAAVARPVRIGARVGALLLLPVTAIAIYGLALRVGDHGWTDDRIAAAACMLVASCYALGYAAAALRRGWLALLAPVNIATAFVVLGTALLLLSPLLDPTRLAVADQLARLESGKVSPAEFDLDHLRYSHTRFSDAALAHLTTAPGSVAAAVRERIAREKESADAWQTGTRAAKTTGIAQLQAWPEGTRLPESFQKTDFAALWNKRYDPDCHSEPEARCDAYLLDLSGDGRPEVVVVSPSTGSAIVVQEADPGRWQAVASVHLYSGRCPETRMSMRRHGLRAAPPMLADIDIGGDRFRPEREFEPSRRCGAD